MVWIWFDDVSQQFAQTDNCQAFLAAEGRFSKRLYDFANELTMQDDKFKRQKGLTSKCFDPANQFLDHCNNLAYGLGATACWVLCSSSLPYR